jgi:hypothetical protein
MLAIPPLRIVYEIKKNILIIIKGLFNKFKELRVKSMGMRFL